MAKYAEVEFRCSNDEQQNIIIALLMNIKYEGFEQDDNSLKAYIRQEEFNEEKIEDIAKAQTISYTIQQIKETNWNALWESNFQPVVVDDFVHGTPWVGIRADFHEPMTGVEHEIIITPKMSFGTGHHATTFMMIQQMREIDFKGKKVFDFGTGTGILAILAEMLGASLVLAVDNDEWSIANATENMERNNCVKVKLEKAYTINSNDQYEIIMANISKNVIIDNFSSLVKRLAPTGILLLSGLLVEDKADIAKEADKFSLSIKKVVSHNNWISLIISH